MGCNLIATAQDVSQIEESFQDLNRQVAQSLAGLGLSALSSAIDSKMGRFYYETGLQAEQAVGPLVSTALGTRDDPTFAKGVHGPDLRHGAGDTNVVIEVKTSWGIEHPFSSHLGNTEAGRQCSDEWLRSHGEDPDNTVVVGVHVDRETETASVYIREDSEARDWSLVVEGASLKDFV